MPVLLLPSSALLRCLSVQPFPATGRISWYQPLPNSVSGTCHVGACPSMMFYPPLLQYWVSASWGIHLVAHHWGASSWCNQGGWTTRRQHCRYPGQLKVPWDSAGEWEPWGSSKKVSHSQLATENKAGPETLAEWEEQGPSHQHIHPASHKIPHFSLDYFHHVNFRTLNIYLKFSLLLLSTKIPVCILLYLHLFKCRYSNIHTGITGIAYELKSVLYMY